MTRGLMPRGVWTLVLVLAATFLFFMLSAWQWRRAEQREALRARWEDHSTPVVLDPAQVAETPDFVLYRAVMAEGRYAAERQLLLDNRTRRGAVGYEVLTPLYLPQGDVLLVNRGWVPLGKTRATRPRVDVTGPDGMVQGRLDHFPRVGLRLSGSEEPQPPWPAVVQLVDPDRLSALYGARVLPLQLLLDPRAPQGYVRDWRKDHIDPQRNRGYAIQWLAFAVLTWVFYLRALRRARH